MLDGPVVPDDLGQVIGHLGPAAAPLAPVLRRRLGETTLDSPGVFERAVPLLSAVAALGDAEAVPEVLRLVRGVPVGVRLRDAVVESAVRALDTLGSVGANAVAPEVVPVLRELLGTEHATVAAGALWSVEADASAVLPVLTAELAEGRPRRRAAAEVLARLGPEAASASAGLRRMVRADDLWERVSAACALWRITGDADLAAPVLRAAWSENPYTRRTITTCLAALGPAGTPLHDLLRTEVAARQPASGGAGGWARQSGRAGGRAVGGGVWGGVGGAVGRGCARWEWRGGARRRGERSGDPLHVRPAARPCISPPDRSPLAL